MSFKDIYKAKNMRKIILIVSILLLAWFVTSFTRGAFTAKRASTKDLTITAHRGGAKLGIENSLECIAKGIEAGATSVEIDVHITADNQIVVCHDPTVDRTTNGSGTINSMTLAKIKQLRLLESGRTRWQLLTGGTNPITAQQIPTLQEVLELIDGRVELLLEIKRKGGDNPGIEARVLEILRQNNALSYTAIQSFDDCVLETLHTLDNSLKLEKLLFCKFIGIPVIFDGTFSRFSPQKYSHIRSFNFYSKGVSKSLSEYLHKNGYHTRIWTHNDPTSVPDIELEGVITDRPDLFCTSNGG